MTIIFETENFLVRPAEFPLIDRDDGGHITIDPKFAVSTRQQLSPKQSIELMRLIAVTGEAMTNVMQRNGVDIGRINYQDNGNWSVYRSGGPQLHYHLYGRARNAVIQPYGQSLYFPHKDDAAGFYTNNKSLTEDDTKGIRDEIIRLLLQKKYADAEWRLC
ncbi:MAG: hypothetical protein JST09_13055 [Bacteroidetes bacterium]|nr:hypothetical protein [Bacteroidota bacterium]